MSKKTLNEQLFIAVKEGNEKKVKQLMRSFISANVVDKDGLTSLHYAAARGYKEIVRILIRNGANVNAADKKGHTPLHEAASLNQVEIAKLLIDEGAQIDAENNGGGTSLYMAAAFGRKDVAKFLISQNADINKADNIHGYTPLHTAAKHGHIEVVQLLLEKGANPALQDKYDNRPIDYLRNLSKENRQVNGKPDAKSTAKKSFAVGSMALLTGAIAAIILFEVELPPVGIVFCVLGVASLAATIASAYIMLKPSTEMQVEKVKGIIPQEIQHV